MLEKDTRRAEGLETEQRGEQLQILGLGDSRNGARPEPCGFDSTTARRVQVLNAAVAWRRRNPRIWAEWERAALREAAQGRRFSMQLVTEQARAFDSVDDSGEGFKLNNNSRAIWARMLVAEHPELRPYIELRRSVWDGLFPELQGGRRA